MSWIVYWYLFSMNRVIKHAAAISTSSQWDHCWLPDHRFCSSLRSDRSGELKVWADVEKPSRNCRASSANMCWPKAQLCNWDSASLHKKLLWNKTKSKWWAPFSPGIQQLPGGRRIQGLLPSSKTSACLFPNLETTAGGCSRSHLQSNHREMLWYYGNSPKERKENSRWNECKFWFHIQKTA